MRARTSDCVARVRRSDDAHSSAAPPPPGARGRWQCGSRHKSRHQCPPLHARENKTGRAGGTLSSRGCRGAPLLSRGVRSASVGAVLWRYLETLYECRVHDDDDDNTRSPMPMRMPMQASVSVSPLSVARTINNSPTQVLATQPPRLYSNLLVLYHPSASGARFNASIVMPAPTQRTETASLPACQQSTRRYTSPATYVLPTQSILNRIPFLLRPPTARTHTLRLQAEPRREEAAIDNPSATPVTVSRSRYCY
jgi:hypothetical protein